MLDDDVVKGPDSSKYYHKRKRFPVCPYCGHQGEGGNDYFQESNCIISTCKKCGEDLLVTAEYAVYYTTNTIQKGRCSVCGKENVTLYHFEGHKPLCRMCGYRKKSGAED